MSETGRAEGVVDAATASDRSALADLFAQDLEVLHVAWPRERVLDVIDAILLRTPRDCILLVVRPRPGDPPVGVAFANVFPSVRHGGPAAWIEQLYVAPEYRRRGYGRALVAALIEEAQRRGLCGLDLESYQLNAPASILYRSMGFRRLGRERFTLSLSPPATPASPAPVQGPVRA